MPQIDAKTKPRNVKRILSVKIVTEADTDPDTSYLGEYANSPTSEFSIDRAHSEDCASLFPLPSQAVDTLNRASDYIMSLRVDSELDTPEDFELQTAIATIEDLIAEWESPDCDCHGGDMRRHELRYFNPSFNYVDKHGKLLPDNTAEEVRKYVRQDYERMEGLNRGSWQYIGIRAVAEVAIPMGAHTAVATIQRITSGGLWGIESDSDKSYLADVGKEELANLKTQLLALGFSRRAISKAFADVQEVTG